MHFQQNIIKFYTVGCSNNKIKSTFIANYFEISFFLFFVLIGLTRTSIGRKSLIQIIRNSDCDELQLKNRPSAEKINVIVDICRKNSNNVSPIDSLTFKES